MIGDIQTTAPTARRCRCSDPPLPRPEDHTRDRTCRLEDDERGASGSHVPRDVAPGTLPHFALLYIAPTDSRLQHALWTTTPDSHPLRLLDIRLPESSPSVPASEPGTTLFQRSSPNPSGSTERTPRLLISCADGEWIDVRRVQAADKREMGVGDWWNGLKMGKEGLVLGDRVNGL